MAIASPWNPLKSHKISLNPRKSPLKSWKVPKIPSVKSHQVPMKSQWTPSEIDGDSAAGLGTGVGRWGAAENARHVLCCESDEDRGRRRLVEDWWRIGVGLVDSWSPVDGSTHKWTNTGWNMMKSGLNDELAICDFWSLVDWFGDYNDALQGLTMKNMGI